MPEYIQINKIVLTLHKLRIHFSQLDSSLSDLHKIQLNSLPSHNL